MKQEQTQAVEAAKASAAQLAYKQSDTRRAINNGKVRDADEGYFDGFYDGFDAGRDHSDESLREAVELMLGVAEALVDIRELENKNDIAAFAEKDARKAVALLAAVRPSSWVSVEERLPDEKYRHEWLHFTLSHSDERWVERRFYDDNLKRRLEERDSLFVAWMPLPEPYQISGPQIEQEKP